MGGFQTWRIVMKRTAMMMAMVVSAGITRAAQESVAVGPASPVQGGKVIKAKSMTAVGAVKTVAADSLTINDGPGKDWSFVIDATTKIIPRAGQETIDVGPVSPVEGGKVLPSTRLMITDIKEGQRVQVKYHNVNGKMHATQVRVM
jgi:Cu/Ag efflux protein CusF